MKDDRNSFIILTSKSARKRVGVGGRRILKWTLKKWVSMRVIELIQFEIRIIGVSWMQH